MLSFFLDNQVSSLSPYSNKLCLNYLLGTDVNELWGLCAVILNKFSQCSQLLAHVCFFKLQEEVAEYPWWESNSIFDAVFFWNNASVYNLK